MGDWIIVLARSAERALLNLDRDSQQRIRAALDELMRGDVKKLKGRPNQFRLRVGHYRVVFTSEYKTRTIAVLEVFHRSRGY